MNTGLGFSHGEWSCPKRVHVRTYLGIDMGGERGEAVTGVYLINKHSRKDKQGCQNRKKQGGNFKIIDLILSHK